MSDFNNRAHEAALDEVIARLLENLKTMNILSDDYKASSDQLVKLMKLRQDNIRLKQEDVKLEQGQEKVRQEGRKVEQEDVKLEQNKIKLQQEESKLDQESVKLDQNATKLNQDEIKLANDIKSAWRPSPDAVITTVGSVIGIVLVLHYEKLGVITSKALGFIGKMK